MRRLVKLADAKHGGDMFINPGLLLAVAIARDDGPRSPLLDALETAEGGGR